MEAEIWPFQVAHEGYLHLRTDGHSLNEIVSGARAIVIVTGCVLRLYVASLY